MLTDEARHVVVKAANQSVKVMYEEYETIPYCFAMLLETLLETFLETFLETLLATRLVF